MAEAEANPAIPSAPMPTTTITGTPFRLFTSITGATSARSPAATASCRRTTAAAPTAPTHALPLRSARAVASATLELGAGQRRGIHAFRHPADHEPGPHQQQPDPGPVQGVGQAAGETVQAGLADP